MICPIEAKMFRSLTPAPCVQRSAWPQETPRRKILVRRSPLSLHHSGLRVALGTRFGGKGYPLGTPPPSKFGARRARDMIRGDTNRFGWGARSKNRDRQKQLYFVSDVHDFTSLSLPCKLLICENHFFCTQLWHVPGFL
jgi:hypothetical protein